MFFFFYHREIIAQEFIPEQLLMVLLKASQFEYLVKKVCFSHFLICLFFAFSLK